MLASRSRRLFSLLSLLFLPALLAPLFPAAHGQRSRAVADLAVTYSSTYALHTDQTNFWMQGGAAEFHVRIYRGLGAVASVTGLHAEGSSPATAPLSLVTAVFGPRFTYAPGRKHFSVFAEALAGEANGFDGVFASGPNGPTGGRTIQSANSLAFQTGCGLDLPLNRRWAVRAFQIDYLRTQLPNGALNTQNNLRMAAGLVFRFGH